MNCLPCFGSKNADNNNDNQQEVVPVAQPKDFAPSPPAAQPTAASPPPPSPAANNNTPANNNTTANNNITAKNNAVNVNKETPTSSTANEATSTNTNKEAAGNETPNSDNGSSGHSFTFRELLSATKNFKQESLIGESSYGKVYKGKLQSSGQVVAVKQLDRHGMQGNKEFLVEVMMLSLLHHPNLVDLIGYCADGEQRLLVFDYMPNGSLANHLFDVPPDKAPLDWGTRMKIASGAAQAVEYLHEKANPSVIIKNLKSSNVLLDDEFNPRLTDYGLAKLEVTSGNTMQQRVMGTYGYCAPEYERNGELTLKSDVYCFGVVLLELITGRKALDTSLPTDQQNLVAWAQPYFKDPKRFPELADPRLKGNFPARCLNQAVGVTAMCLQEESFVRPLISDVVAALSFLSVAPPDDDQTQLQGEVPRNDEDGSSSSSGSEGENSGSGSEDDEGKHGGARNDNDDGSGSSSESLYNEDEFSDGSQQQEEGKAPSMRRGSRSRSKKKVGGSTSNVGRKSSRRKSEDDRNNSVGKSSRRKRSGRRKNIDGEDSDASSKSNSSVSKFSVDSRTYSNNSE